MNRRAFLKTAGAAGLAAAPTSAVLGYTPQHDSGKAQSGSNPDLESPEQILLKDYRPKSIYKIPVTEIARAKFPIIDMHSHPYAKTPEQIARMGPHYGRGRSRKDGHPHFIRGCGV